jgi:hypothetical protein
MILEIVHSISNVPIRLTQERWDHIVDAHPYMSSNYEDMLDAIEAPEYILLGFRGALVAVVVLGKKRILHVMYRELSRDDGFIITAYLKSSFEKKRVVWQKED